MKKIFSLFLVALLLFASPPAGATILFAGGEDFEFSGDGTTVTTTTTSTCYQTGYARAAVGPLSNAAGHFIRTPVFTSTTAFWTHFYFSQNCGAALSLAGTPTWLRFHDSSGIVRLAINRPNTGVLQLYKADSAATYTLLTTSTGAISSNSTYDIYINYASSGEFTVYKDGSLLVTYSGDITTNGQTTLAQAGLGNATGTSSTQDHWYSEVIVATTDTRSMRLATIQPVANGNAMAWTGAVTDVNETTLSDATAITSGTSDQLAQFTVPSLPSGTFGVEAIVQSLRASRGSTGPQNLQFVTRTGGSDYTSSSQSLTTTYQNYQYLWATNPATSSAWTTSDIGAAGFNLGIKSKP